MRDKVSNLHKTADRITFGISVFSGGKWEAENIAPLHVVLHYCNNLYMARIAKHCICLVLILQIQSENMIASHVELGGSTGLRTES